MPRTFSLTAAILFLPLALLLHLIFGAKGDVIVLAALFWTAFRAGLSAAFAGLDRLLPPPVWPANHPRLQLDRYWRKKLARRLSYGFSYFFWLLAYAPPRSDTFQAALLSYMEVLTGPAGAIMAALFAALTAILYLSRIISRRT